jgi:hypothetical protein
MMHDFLHCFLMCILFLLKFQMVSGNGPCLGIMMLILSVMIVPLFSMYVRVLLLIIVFAMFLM